MNPNQPSRDEIEVKITALLLGELPADEASLLHYTISQDAELKKLHDELASTIVLVREAMHPAEAPAEKIPALKLSGERREKLLAHFKTPRPQPENPLFWLKPIPFPKVPRLVEVLVVVAIVALLAAMLLPALSKAKSKAQRVTLLNAAKQRALEEQIRLEDEKAAKALPADSSFQTVTVAAAPAIAPPPAEIVLPSSAPEPSSVDGGETYVIKSGDTLTKIAREHGTTIQSLEEANNLSSSKIFAGAKLKVPAEPVAMSSSVAVVAPEPILAPPAAQIVLPPTESPAQVATISPRFGGSGGGGGGGAPPIFESQRLPGISSAAAESASEEYRLLDDERKRDLSRAGAATGGAIGSDQLVIGGLRSQQQTQMRATAGQTVINGVNFEQGAAASTGRMAAGNTWAAANRQPATTPVPSGAPDRSRADSFAFDDVSTKTEDAKASLLKSPASAKPQSAAEPNQFVGRNAYVAESGEKLAFNDGKTYSGTTAISGGALVMENSGSIKPLNRPAPIQNKGAAVGYVSIDKDTGGIRYLYSTNAILAKNEDVSSGLAMDEITLRKAKEKIIDRPLPKPSPAAPIPQPEYLCRENAFSTFSLNVSDVSFKLAAASLERGQMPDSASIRSEEFINAFDYRDPEAAAGQPLAFTAERARYPFAQNRDLLRFSVKTAAAGRPAGRALNLVLLLDNSGSMERADRVAIIREALRVLGTQLQPQDTVSVVTFARTARLWADGVRGDQAGKVLTETATLTPEGGTNLEEAMKLAYETARRHYLANGMNRVVLLTDGAANLGDVNPADLQQKVEAQRQQGIALDCFGIGFEDFNDDLLQQLSSHGDGRYAFLNSPEDVSKEFAAKLAGALQVAASDVKVQVEFNPQRVISWRQIGYAKHQLTKEQFRDNTVDAAEIAAQEAGNALYTVETKSDGTGPIATVRVRYKVPGTTEYRERSWDVAYEGGAAALAQSSAAMRLAASAGAFSEWLAASPFAQEVTPDELLKTLSGVPQVYGADKRPAQLETMLREAKSVAGK